MANMTRESAVEIMFPAGGELDKCVQILLDAKERGESVFGNFNGHKLYSCDVTMDDAYMQVLGMTKAEFDEKDRKLREEYEEREKIEKEEAENKIPEWIEKGKFLIYPERLQDWKKCVEDRASDIYYGSDLDYALHIMEKLESGAPIEEAIEMFKNKSYSGVTATMIKEIIFDFSKRGPEFYQMLTTVELDEENKRKIEEKKKENEKLEAMHASKEAEETEKHPIGSLREREEEEIPNLAARRTQLQTEISDIEMQLSQLKEKEAELKKQFESKQDELNKLYE